MKTPSETITDALESYLREHFPVSARQRIVRRKATNIPDLDIQQLIVFGKYGYPVTDIFITNGDWISMEASIPTKGKRNTFCRHIADPESLEQLRDTLVLWIAFTDEHMQKVLA